MKSHTSMLRNIEGKNFTLSDVSLDHKKRKQLLKAKLAVAIWKSDLKRLFPLISPINRKKKMHVLTSIQLIVKAREK